MASTPTPPPRTRLPRGQRRALLLKAARTAFGEQGFHATAMEDIADRAGISKPVLYQHFDSKLDLYLAVAREVSDEVVGTVRSALDSSTEPQDRIVACVSSFFGFVDRPNSGYPMIFLSDMAREPAVAVILDETRLACGELIGRAVAERTALSPEESVLLGITMAGLAQTAALQWYSQRDTLDRERVTALVTGAAWHGLRGLPLREDAHEAADGQDSQEGVGRAGQGRSGA